MSLREMKALSEDFWEEELSLLSMESSLYQGAHTGAYAEGIFVAMPDQDIQVWHNDVKSMYPSIMRQCNFSPETLRLVALRPYTGKTFLSPTLVEIPDDRIGKQVVMEVSEEDGAMRTVMGELMDLRVKYRVEKSDTAEKGMKLAANAIYGYQGMRYARYGSFLVALATTGVGRYIMEGIVEIATVNPLVTLLENDTDGVYTYGPTIIEHIREMLDDMFNKFPKRYAIRVDTTKYHGMLCTGKMKNYVLRKEFKNIVKGNSLKGRSMPPVCKSALESIADALFEGQSVEEAYSAIVEGLRESPLSDFEMSVEVGKERDEYKETTMYAKLLQQAPWMQFGEELRYVRVNEGGDYAYKFVPLGAVPDEELLRAIDHSYYLKRTKDTIARLLIPCRAKDADVDHFLKENIDKKKKKRKKKK